jgi:hypothetical protein
VFEEGGGRIAVRLHLNDRPVQQACEDLPLLANRDVLGVPQVRIIGNEGGILEEFGPDVLQEGVVEGVAGQLGSGVAGVVFVPLAAFVEDPAYETED